MDMKNILSNKFKSQVRQIFWITFGWTIIAVFQFFNGYATLKNYGCDLTGFQFGLFLNANIFTGVIAGVVGGSVVTLLWEEWLRSKNYGWALFYIFLSFSLTYLVVTILTRLYVYHIELGLSMFEREIWEISLSNLGGVVIWQSYLFWLFIVLATLIILQVNDKYGPGMFPAFLMGKYFRPKREERIFMFLDLRSSTTIAEKLGEERYFHFLNDVFKHATPAILNSKGEIYQYVGDEIVVSWKMEKGRENANCLRCFFDIQAALRRRVSYYTEHYGIQPEFKAGLHYGHVMAGEMGVVKRDIAYSGDVLNMASRIQTKCNELGVNILLSKFLLDRLSLPPKAFEPAKVGNLALRGKEHKVALYTV
jgi:adenylate cyclase